MYVEVDQSIRIDDTRKASIFAFSNDIKKAILISAKVKRECLVLLREQGRRGATIYVDLFSASLWLLLCNDLAELSQIVIDTEFSGERQQAKIKARLLRYAREAGITLHRDQITFQRVTKESPAHALAHAVHQQRIRPDRRVRTGELLALVK